MPSPYTDVPETHPHYGNIVWAGRLYLMRGYGDGTFRPDQPITRAEAATVALRCALVSTALSLGAAGVVLLGVWAAGRIGGGGP